MSLRVRLLVIIGVALTVLWGGAAVWMLQDLNQGLQKTLDERLAMSARMVSGLLLQSSFTPGASPITARGAHIVPGSRGMACQVRSLRGEIVATTRDRNESPLRADRVGYRTVSLDGHRWRTYTLRANGLEITTADRLDERALLRWRSALAAGIPFLIAGCGGLVAVWFGVGRALSPLRDLQWELGHRRPEASEPIETRRVPAELLPVVTALNALLQRVAESIQRERSFTSDAAHELRTPLTAVDTHLQVARLTRGNDAERALRDAALSVTRMRSMLDQLLMLARLEGRASFEDGERISAREVLDRALSMESADQCSRVRISGDVGGETLDVPAAMAVVALRNVIDNALKYSPSSEPIEIEITEHPAMTTYRVVDHGPGMTDEELSAATRRFWRRERHGEGVGLGLTLVGAIADRFSGKFALQRHRHGGLLAELALPRGRDD